MTAKAVVIHDRLVDALLAGLIIMTLITEPGGPVLCLAKAMVDLVIAVGELVARYAAVYFQGAVDTGSAHFTPVTPVAGLTAEGIDRPFGSGENATGLLGEQKSCDCNAEQYFY